MAEGVEVEIPRASQKYFCHECTREVTAIYPDLTCIRCQSGFIEEVPECNDGSDESDLDIEQIGDVLWFAREEEDPFRRLVRRTIAQTIFDFDQGGTLNSPTRTLLGEWLGSHASHDSARRSSRDDDDDEDIGFNFFREILLARNLGDYAIGLEWDAVITQILNETEVSGPPPLAKEEIEKIPFISILESHVNNGLQCTICMDDFVVEERVMNLLCEHIFHKDCIVPWLEMHATCPICRKHINGDSEQEPLFHRRPDLSDSSAVGSSRSSTASSSRSSSNSTSTSSSSSTASSGCESTSETSSSNLSSSSYSSSD